tara:strand:+ start:7524 stop:7949 length:426 start_codon:yes stop_codon:yes gene_type:complete
MSKEFKVIEYKASDLVKGKMNEAFKNCSFGRPIKVTHKQHGDFFMFNKEYTEGLINGVMLSFCGLSFSINDEGTFYIDDTESLDGLENEHTKNVKKIMNYNCEGIPDMKDPFMFLSTIISTAMFWEDDYDKDMQNSEANLQ